MSENVTLTHPGLPGRQLVVRADAVRHHKRAGWRPAVESVEIAAARREVTAPRIKSRGERAINTSELKPETTPEPDNQSADTEGELT